MNSEDIQPGWKPGPFPLQVAMLPGCPRRAACRVCSDPLGCADDCAVPPWWHTRPPVTPNDTQDTQQKEVSVSLAERIRDNGTQY